MDRARLTDKASAKVGEDRVRRRQHAPEAIDGVAIVSGVPIVLIEGNRFDDLARRHRDLYVQPEFVHCGEQRGCELGDRHWPE